MKYASGLKNNNLNNQEKQDNRIIFALCVIFFIPAINNFVNAFIQIGLSIPVSILTPISYIFMAFVSVFFLYKFVLKKLLFFGIFIFCVLGSALSYFIYPEIRDILYSSPVDLVYSPINKLIFYCIPAMVGIFFLTNYKKLFEKMRIWSLVTAILGIIVYFYVTIIRGEALQYMVFSYFLLLPTCVCFEYATMNNSKLDSIIAVCATISMIACGARGAIISLLLYFLMCFSRYDFRRMRIGQVVKLFALILSVVIVALFHNELLTLVSKTFDSLGIDSRVISYLIEGNFLDDNGRDNITSAIWDGIFANPLGYGIYGDRYVSGAFGAGRYQYAHNIFVELLCDFGIVGGTIVIILLAYVLSNLIVRFKRKNEIHLVFAFVPYAIFQLLFSSSYLENILFFALMGLALTCVLRKNSEQLTEE
jgi:oligosaccharide repeat unit polymerase